MIKNFWLLLGVTLTTNLIAQQVTNPPPASALDPVPAAISAPAVEAVAPDSAPPKVAAPKPAKAKTSAKKKAASKKVAAKKPKPAPTAVLRSIPLVPGQAIVVASNVNVRGQAKLRSEIVTRITKGQQVTVIEEIVRNDSADDEPSAWAKIVLPNSTPVWVNSMFLSNNAVVPPRLNLRGGPGENYSILGRIVRGAEVKPITTKGNWTQIEPPADAYAFVAAQYLSQEAATEIVAVPPTPEVPSVPVIPEVPVTPETIAEAPVVAAPPSEAPALSSVTPTEIAAVTPATNHAALTEATNPDTMPEDVIEEPPPKRIVQREGIVRGTVSIQAPSHFGLVDPENFKLINYLYTSSPSLDLRRYKGLRVIVTGEEALEERWGNTPVITLQKIEVLEE